MLLLAIVVNIEISSLLPPPPRQQYNTPFNLRVFVSLREDSYPNQADIKNAIHNKLYYKYDQT